MARVRAPEATSARTVGSLEASATLVVNENEIEQTPDGPVRWVQGFSYWPEDCAGGNRIAPCSDDATEPAEDTPEDVREFTPYLVTASVTCGTFGVAADGLIEEYRQRALRKLRAVRSALIETEFWAGTKAVSHSLANNYLAEATGSSILEGGNLLGYQTALAELEQAAADQSDWEQAYIHATPRTVTHWIAAGLVEREGTRLFTELGSVVVAGRGYPGSAPALPVGSPYAGAVASDTAWAYVTGPVDLRLGPADTRTTDEPSALVARNTNELKITAAQFVAATWSGCVLAAAHVDNTAALSDTGS